MPEPFALDNFHRPVAGGGAALPFNLDGHRWRADFWLRPGLWPKIERTLAEAGNWHARVISSPMQAQCPISVNRNARAQPLSFPVERVC